MGLRHRVEYGGYVAGRTLLRALPLGGVQGVGGWAARSSFDRGGRRAHYARVNLRLAFPDLSEEQRDEIGRESFANVVFNFLDVMRGERWSDDEVRERVTLHGVENFERALEAGRGFLGLSLHMGNFEITGRRISMEIPATIVGRALKNTRIYQKVVDQRSASGGQVISHKGAAPGILRALRKGRMVGIFNDQYSRRSRGIFVPLFGARCSTGAGLAILALRTGVPVVPFYSLREGPDRHAMYVEPALEPPNTGNRTRDIEEATTGYNAALERIIRAHPEQWVWSHRRFRHSPDLPGDPYALPQAV